MAWTYDSTKLNDATVSGTYPPATLGQLYQVRLLLQDTQTTRQLLQDDEIYWLITQESNAYMAAAACCDTLVARAGSIKSKRISEFSITYDYQFYHDLGIKLRARGMSHQLPYAGGISIADKLAHVESSDTVKPGIFRGVDDNQDAPATVIGPVSNPLTIL